MLVKPLVRPIVRAIAGRATDSLGSGFSPSTLFSGGAKGAVYDASDLSTLYLDAAGTTAATVNGLVGLQLDKSAGLASTAASIDGVMNTGTWTKGTGWTATGTRSISCDGTNGASSDVGAVYSKPANTFVRYTFNIVSITGTLSVYATQSVPTSFTTPGRKQVYSDFGADFNIFRATAGTVVVVEDIRIEVVSGAHRYQSTTGSKPILRGSPVGANLVTNGDFASGTGWTTGAGWAIGSGVATATASSGTLTSTLTATIAKVYRLTYEVTRSAGSVQPSFGGVSGASRSAAGTYVEYLTASSTAALVFTGTTFSGTVDNVEVVDVSAGSVQAPYALQFDGVDDFLITAAVNFTATDKMTVCHGVRKLSDATRTMLVELGSTPGTNTFRIEAPPSASPAYSIISGGSLTTSLQSASSFAAPVINVLTGIMDIAGDSLRLRINASEQTPVTSDQGTGNFGNLVLYFGRRGGTTLPYNGLMFSSVCVGKTVSAIELANIERWVNIRTGAY